MVRSLFLMALICSAHQCTHGGIIFLFEDNTTLIGSGLDNQPFGSFTVSGLEITATASTGSFNATSSGFGINQSASGDDTDGFDFEEGGGPGLAEGLMISFDSDVWLNNIDVSSFGGSDEIMLTFSSGTFATVSSTGTTSLGNTFVAASDPITIATTAGNYGNGWSLDFIEATAVPEPSSLLFLGTVALLPLWRMRRKRHGV